MADLCTPRFFISYAHADRASAERLIGDLKARGVTCWRDEQDLQPGTPDWEQAIRRAIRTTQGVILISSPNVPASRYVQDELRFAEAKGRPVYPFWVAGDTWMDSIPLGWGGAQYIDARGERYATAVAKLVNVAHGVVPASLPAPEAVVARRSTLPAPLTPFIGREREVGAVCALLGRAKVQLVTLTGAGGTGKTRLALQVAAMVQEDYPDGVYFVSLAPLSDPALVASTMAQTLGVKETGSEPLSETLKDYLRSKQLLLVLDNFEQVLAATPLVVDLLAACPGLTVLVTSRARLHVYGEHEYPVPPLAVPDLRHLPSLASLTQYEAVRLFIARAQDVKPDFAVTNETAPAVAEICVHLDGLPLAIELAAARIRVLPPQAMLRRLDNRLKFVTGGARDLPARLRTLRATIDWSYSLLSEAEQRLFARLAVFVGGRTLEAIEAVCNPDGALDVLEGVESLVEKNLLRQQEGVGGEARLVMLETIHEYARERLAASGEAEEVRRRHAEYFLKWAEEAEPELRGPQQGAWVQRLEAEHDNLRAALSWSKEQATREVGLRLGGALWQFWEMHGHLSEGRRWLEEALGGSGEAPAPARATALNGAGMLAFWQSDYGRATALHEESLTLMRELADKRGIARSLNNLGIVAYAQGDHGRATELHEKSLALRRKLADRWGIAVSLGNLGLVAYDQGDYGWAATRLEESLALLRERGDTRNIATSLNNLGNVAYQQGDYGQAAALHEEALSLRRELGDSWGIASSLGSLGLVAYDQGDYGRAVALYKESLAKCREIGNKYIAVYCLAGLAAVVCAQGQLQRAAQLFGAAEATRGLIGAPLPPSERPCYERLVTAVRTQLDKETFAAAWAAGRALSLEQAIAYALAEDVARGERYDTVVATPVNVGQALEPPQPPRPGPVVLPPPPSDRAPRSPYKGLRPFMAAIGAIWP